MKSILVVLCLMSSAVSQAEMITLKSPLYSGELFHNEKRTGAACYVQINRVIPNLKKGKHCNIINTRMMFDLDDIKVHQKDMELLLGSRRTNNDTEFKLPGTCGAVKSDVLKPWEIDRWGDDTTHLYNQAFTAQYKVSHRDNQLYARY